MAAPHDLEQIYDAHAQALYAFLLNLTRNQADTYDILQELLVKIAQDPGLLTDVHNERAFLLRLAHNLLIDSLRRKTTRERYHEQAGASSGEPLFAPVADPDAGTFRQALSAALARLPVDQHAVIHLKLWEGLTFEDIAELLQIPPNTAASRYRYGLDKLREQLRPLYDEIR